MGEILKPAGQWIANNVPLSILIALLIFSFFFKIPKKEIHLFSWLLQKLGNALLGGLRQDVKDLKDDNTRQFNEMKADYIEKITNLKTDLDNFEERTKNSMDGIVTGNNENCKKMQSRLNDIEKKQNLQTASRIRAHVLNFSEDLRRGNARTLEDFNNLLEENKEYKNIVEKYKLENDVYVHALKFINKKYDEFMETDGFAKY